MSWFSDRVSAVTNAVNNTPIIGQINGVVNQTLSSLPTGNLAAHLKSTAAAADTSVRNALTQIDPTNLSKQEATALVKAGIAAATGNYAAAAATVAQGYQQSRQIAAGKATQQQALDSATAAAETQRAHTNNVLNQNQLVSDNAAPGISPTMIGAGVIALAFLL